jgi:hypothetical protein
MNPANGGAAGSVCACSSAVCISGPLNITCIIAFCASAMSVPNPDITMKTHATAVTNCERTTGWSCMASLPDAVRAL